MKKLDRKEMMNRLKAACPGLFMRFGEHFSESYRGAIWTVSEDSDVVHRASGLVPFEYMAESHLYLGGVLCRVRSLLEEHGWIAEWYDGGTIMIYCPD